MTRGQKSPATGPPLPRRLASDESGQILLMTGVLMVVMLILVALVVDIGHTRLVQRQLQAGVDAAALAGALDLPFKDTAEATAKQYSPTPGKKNSVNTIDNAETTAQARCITTIPGCDTRLRPVNALTVESTAKVPTFFARIIGIDSLTVTAKATACFPCSVRPVDIVIVLDRTGSMCQGGCTDFNAARDGVKSFLLAMDPKLDRVALAVLPPAVGPSVWGTEDGPPCLRRDWRGNCTQWTQVQVRNPDSPQNVCSTPTRDPFYYGYMAYSPYWEAESDPNYRNGDRGFYVVSSLSDDDEPSDPASDDYLVKDAQGQWVLNNSSPIVSTLNCVRAAGSTSYSMALDEAAHELEIHGRPNVPKAIVFFTDGGANTFPNPQATDWPSSGSPWKERPCGSAVEAAKRYPNIAIYTIGYDLDNVNDPGQQCLRPLASGRQDTGSNPTREDAQVWGRTPKEALAAMASTPANFYYTADPQTLQLLFVKIAGDVLTNAARLVDNSSPDLMD